MSHQDLLVAIAHQCWRGREGGRGDQAGANVNMDSRRNSWKRTGAFLNVKRTRQMNFLFKIQFFFSIVSWNTNIRQCLKWLLAGGHTINVSPNVFDLKIDLSIELTEFIVSIDCEKISIWSKSLKHIGQLRMLLVLTLYGCYALLSYWLRNNIICGKTVITIFTNKLTLDDQVSYVVQLLISYIQTQRT